MKTPAHNFLFASALFLLTTKHSGQSKVYTFIQENDKGKVKSGFYVHKVVDARADKSNIGQIYSSDLRKKYPADFEHNLSEEFHRFFKGRYASSRQKQRVLMLVQSFSISHEHSEVFKDEGKAILQARYYLNRNDTCFFLYAFHDSILDVTNEVQRTHPNRIKRLLLLSAKSLSDTLLKPERLAQSEKSPLEDLLHLSNSPAVESARKQDSLNVPPDYYMFGVGTYYNFYPSVYMFGVSGHLLLRLGKTSPWLAGPSAAFLMYSTKPNAIQAPTYNEDVLNYDVGIRLIRQIKKNLFLNVQPQLMFGRVKEPGNTGTQVLKGFQTDLGLYLIPPAAEGVYSGINFFYRTTNTDYFGEGLGLKLDLGYRF